MTLSFGCVQLSLAVHQVWHEPVLNEDSTEEGNKRNEQRSAVDTRMTTRDATKMDGGLKRWLKKQKKTGHFAGKSLIRQL